MNTISTGTELSKARPAGNYRVKGVTGLYLQVSSSGSRSWIYRYHFAGRRREMGLGSADKVSLAHARKATLAAAASRDRGDDPIEARRKGRQAAIAASRPVHSQTFKAAAEAYIATHVDSWRGRYALTNFRNPLRNHIYPVLGAMDVREIRLEHIVAALRHPAKKVPYTATRLRAQIETILDYATAKGFRDPLVPNPARLKGNLAFVLPKSKHKVRHYPRPELDAAPALFRRIAAAEGSAFAAWAFMILTTSRPSEALRAQWSEIDLGKKLWTVPAGRMKAGKAHIVPLSSVALAVIERQAKVRSGDAIFPGASGHRPVSYDAFAKALALRLGIVGITPHGWRSVFRDWAGDIGDVERDIAEAQLAHALSATEGSYRRLTAVERRRAVLERYADWLEGREATVIPFPKVAAAE